MDMHNLPEDLARSGAQSVFSYVRRTAETVPDGVRWQTLSYENEPQYSAALGNGVAGIALFLADYYRLTQDQAARDLAHAGLRWCMSPAQTVEDDGLCGGRAGIGLAWLRVAAATGDREALAMASSIGDTISGRAPGSVTTLYGGAAGEGVFLARLAEQADSKRHLAGAIERGEWLADTAVRDARGYSWTYQTDDEPWYGLGLGPGVAGIGLFFTRLYQVTGDPRWAEVVRQAARTLLDQAQPDRGGLNWAQTLGEAALLRCQLCDGSPGIGLFFAKAAEVLDDPAFLETAKAAAEATYAYGDVRHNASQCHGLSGNAGLFLELFRITREPLWLDRAYDFARRSFAYRTSHPEGETWAADDAEGGYVSPEFLSGASGTGHFFLRLWKPDEVPFALL
jgi:lantibiotic modifying enzyme